MTNNDDEDQILDMEVHMVLDGGHRHLLPQMTQRDRLLSFHVQLHMLGLENSHPHSRCMEALAEVEEDLVRGLQAIWN